MAPPRFFAEEANPRPIPTASGEKWPFGRTRARLVAVAGSASEAEAKRSEAKGGNLTADGWP